MPNPYKNTLRDEFGESWSIAPWDARVVTITDADGKTRTCPIDQDTVEEIIEYFLKASEAMND